MKIVTSNVVPIAMLTIAASLSEVRAQALPGWRIADICAAESAPGQCAAFEGLALNAVSASWPFILDPIKQTCVEQAKSSLDQSWRLLAECIDAETLKALDRTAVNTDKTPAEPVPPPNNPVDLTSPAPTLTAPVEAPKAQ